MNDEKNVYGEEIEKFDLEKYGLSDLQGRNILTLSPTDMTRLLSALGDDDISLNVPMACTPKNVDEVLSYSKCRRCGRCCTPNPLNPSSPGIEVFEEELKAAADYLEQQYDETRKKTTTGNVTAYAFQAVKLGFTRWLPLPCPFYGAEGGCAVYPVRAVVCKTYPIIFTGDDSYMSIRVTCDYGKDIFSAVCERIVRENPGLEITL